MAQAKQQSRKTSRRAWIWLLLVAALAAALSLTTAFRRIPGSFHRPERTARVEDPNWMLTLVNPWNPLKDGYIPELEEIEDDHCVDVRCADALREMLADCRAAGLSPVICSSYRDMQTQQALFDDKVARVMAEEHCSRTEAEEIAATVVAPPGTSEHQLGLAVDIVDASYQQLDTAQEQTAVQQWLMAHCHEYGFILRYPSGTSDITGIIYEPWHYRYVGSAAAKEITEGGICLEQYLAFR